MGREPRVTDASDYRFFAGWRSDPFFFDTQGAINNLQFTGDDFFADKDVCSIVMEVPNSALGAKTWACGLVRWTAWREMGSGGPRRAAAASCLPYRAESADYLAGERRMMPVSFLSSRTPLQHAGGYTPEEAKRVAATLLPDILPYDPRRPASFPNNGRTLTDA